MGFEPASDILSKYTVLDLTRVRSGQLVCASWQTGARMSLKLKRRWVRYGGKRDGSDFQNLHRNKRSLVLDLKSEDGVKIFLKLAAKADVIVENYRPDVKFRLGIDYETVKALNPKIVYASISGFGQDGPLSGGRALIRLLRVWAD